MKSKPKIPTTLKVRIMAAFDLNMGGISAQYHIKRVAQHTRRGIGLYQKIDREIAFTLN